MVSRLNHKSMPTSQTWSYSKTHIEMLCHDISSITIHHNSISYKHE
ncbi:hypothetical protein F383_10479 [Gossypium arboreum]|uniref:Uncharacterized protein n=1 Tax=Gossypium arboreum TaxID=29729 RepID=A0A0B0N8N6_GOSAR|nr:hypothetical protein F383_34700 [Gossypium arboreum]KHG23228.1 hypothetical protein F383_10479 [Gossypium arboreum]